MSFRSLTRFILGACLLLGACASPTPNPTPVPPVPTYTEIPSPSPQPRPFRVIGYATSAVIVEAIPYPQLTHINFAFLLPNADGTFAPLPNAWKIKALVDQSHANNVKVLVSVGGWGLDTQFEQLAASPETRAVFIAETIKVLAEYGFDGVDIDWEYPDPGQSAQNYLALMSELRKALPDHLITTAVIAYGDETGLGVPSETFALLDFINVMTYDGPDHGSMEQFQKGLDYWLGRGVPPEKLVMGLPFYSRPGEVPYRKLLKNDPTAAEADIAVYNGSQERYNGRPTVQKKTRIAMQQASGIMFWTLENDALGKVSLVNAINQVVTGQKP
jgi:GH18 family chitinase